MIRHGIAQHNVVRGEEGRNIFDSSLTPSGVSLMQQTGVMLRQQLLLSMSTNSDHASAHLIILSSPLSRCLETSGIICSQLTKAASSTSIPPSRISCYSHELLREAYGVYKSDCRRKKSELQRMFPFVVFDPSMPEDDLLWTYSERESLSSVCNRVKQMFHHLATIYCSSSTHQQYKDNTVILLVTHGVWMECFLNQFAPHLMQGGARRVYNGDVYRGELVYISGDDSSENLHKHGKLQNVDFISSGFR